MYFCHKNFMGVHTLQITDDKLYDTIVSYCKENKLKIGAFCTEMLRKQVMDEMYGDIVIQHTGRPLDINLVDQMANSVPSSSVPVMEETLDNPKEKKFYVDSDFDREVPVKDSNKQTETPVDNITPKPIKRKL